MLGQAGEQAGIGAVEMTKPEKGRLEGSVVLGWTS